MYIKRDKARIKRIVLDLHDVIFDSRKVVLFEYEQPSLNQQSEQNITTINLSHWDPRKKMVFAARCTLVKRGAVHSG